MKIGVIGMGSVGGALGRRWAEHGHEVAFGARDPGSTKAKGFAAAIKGAATVVSISNACVLADVVVLATPWDATVKAIGEAGDLAGKIVIDVTNPVRGDLSGLAVGADTSGAEEVQRHAKGARVYKTLNQTGWETMADPSFRSAKPVMFVAGDEPQGKATVMGLVDELGFEAVDAGGLDAARMLEWLAMLWIHLMVNRKLGRRIAFALMRKEK